ncbi:hypothetical protein [Nocardioides sp. P5_E3]
MRTRTLIASVAAGVVLTGCSASADEPTPPKPDATSSATPSASSSASPELPETSSTTTAVPEVSVTETKPAKPARPTGWTGPKDGIRIESTALSMHGEANAKAAANAAMNFLRKWTLREDLMRADLPAARTALQGVTPELAPNAAAAWQQNLTAAKDLKNDDAWGNLQALVRVGSPGAMWDIPADEPLVTNRTFLGDVFVASDRGFGGLRVNIDYANDYTRVTNPAKPQAGRMRVHQESMVSLVMTNNDGNGWKITSWEGTFDSDEPVALN